MPGNALRGEINFDECAQTLLLQWG